MWTTNSVVKLPRLALQVEMSWHNSLVQSVDPGFIVTQLSELVSCRLKHRCVVCRHKQSTYPLVLGNPLAVLKYQLRDSRLFVSTLLVDSSTLGVADHHPRSF